MAGTSAGASGTRYKCGRCKGTFILGNIDLMPPNTRFQQCPTCMFMNALPNKTLKQLSKKQPEYSAPIPLEYLKANIYPGLGLDRVLQGVRTEELRGPATAFFENVVRLQTLLLLPIVASAYSRLFEQKKAEAVSITTTPVDDPGYNEAIDEAITYLCLKWMAESTDETRGIFIHRYGAKTFFRLSSGPIRAGSEAILVSQLTGMWTAFESLAGDLWTCAVNAHPQVLAKLEGSKNRISNSQKERERQQSDTSGTVERELLDKFSRGTYDLRHKMGNVLRESFSFIKLSGIRVAYSRAFSERYEKIDAALSNRALDALNAIRNVIVHNAGRIDDEYFDKAKSLPTIPRGAIGEQIAFDGLMVEALAKPVFEISRDLIAAVDSWIVGARAVRVAKNRNKKGKDGGKARRGRTGK